jgi:ElaB/YqjD/DUF883 family membrane-anchored ribosome-binding protein
MMNSLREARIRRDLNSVANQVDSLLHRMGEDSAERMADWRDRMGMTASSVGASTRARLSALDSTMRDSARSAAKVTDTFVHDNPWRAIGAGAVIGLLLGYLASRR